MIKTALTVSISSADIQQFSYVINSTHLGLLSSATQSIHIQTSHRPIQYIIGVRAEEPDVAANLAQQRQIISRWQTFLPVLMHRGSMELNALLQQYQLQPDLMVCYDENRLQAWIPAQIGFFLLRSGELRRLKPVPLQEPVFTKDYHETHHFYMLQISQDDFYLLLPPDLPPVFAQGEAADLLLGLRQLPAKMSELIQVARQRGYQKEITWMAVEVLRKEADQQPGQERSSAGQWLSSIFGRRNQAESDSHDHESDSESMADDNDTTAVVVPTGLRRLLSSRTWRIRLVLAAVLILALVAVGTVWAFSRNSESDPTAVTTGPSDVTPTLAVTSTPAPTARPTASPTPTEPPVILVVSARRLNLRDAPNRDGTLLTTLDNGDPLVQLSEPEDDWVKVRTEDGLVGYVYALYVTGEDPG